jgi:hypothetical protein
MTDEVLFHHGTTTVRRLCLAPGESMPWHRDPFHRVAVVLSGDVLLIEYRDGGESLRVEISSGQVDWEEPASAFTAPLMSASYPTYKSQSSRPPRRDSPAEHGLAQLADRHLSISERWPYCEMASVTCERPRARS